MSFLDPKIHTVYVKNFLSIQIILKNLYGLICKCSLGGPTYVPSSVTLKRNIPLMRRQNTDIVWNRMMLWANVTLFHSYVTLLHSDVTLLHSDVTLLHSDVTLLHFDVTLLYSDVTLLHSDTCTRRCYVTCLNRPSEFREL